MLSKSNDPAILFDPDGTLVDTAYRHVASWPAVKASGSMTEPNPQLNPHQ